MFELHFSHTSCTPHTSLLLFISSFLSLIPLDSFVYSWQKRGEHIKEYTRVYHHFYMTHVHILKGRNSTLCTFVGGESHKEDACTKGEKTSFLRKSCFVLFYACFLAVLRCFELGLPSMLCYSHYIVFVCWTCIHPYAIVFHWMHIRMIICFVIWSL